MPTPQPPKPGKNHPWRKHFHANAAQAMAKRERTRCPHHQSGHFYFGQPPDISTWLDRWRAGAGVEMKAAATVHRADFRGLRKLQAALWPRFAGGVVLYDGELGVTFGEGRRAVPLRSLWETG